MPLKLREPVDLSTWTHYREQILDSIFSDLVLMEAEGAEGPIEKAIIFLWQPPHADPGFVK